MTGGPNKGWWASRRKRQHQPQTKRVLTDSEKLAIFQRWSTTETTMNSIARDYRVHPRTIARIINKFSKENK